MDTYFFPDPGRAVLDAARGLALAHPGTLAVNADPLYLRALRRAPQRRVALVSGGGAGHEPLHAGFLGPGGLDAVCPGQVFTSPHNRQVFEAARAVALPGGVLLVVKNYTGDVINFAVAAERLRAAGTEVATVLVDDDLATDSAEAATGRRGTAATVVVEKVLGAAADAGRGLAELADLGTRVAARSRSIAVASRAQTSPATGEPAFALGPGELEYGVGIHGERAARTVPGPGTRALVERMLDELLAAVAPGPDGVALVVNGLGGATDLELHAVAASAGDLLAARGASLGTALVGTFTAALDMRGFSLTLTGLEEGWLELLEAPTQTPALPRAQRATGSGAAVLPASGPAPVPPPGPAPEPAGAASGPGSQVLRRYAEVVAAVRADLTRLDQRSGDGDFGDNLSGGLARALDRGQGLTGAGAVFLDEVGGSSGPLFGLVLSELAPPVERGQGPGGVAAGLRRGLEAVQRVGGAQVGDRTLVDALAPAADALAAGTGGSGDQDALTRAAQAAVAGAAGTADLRARRGRASYVGDRARGAQDPGAVGVALLLVVLAQVLEPRAAGRLPSPAQVVAGRQAP
jgi:triose/dihydroxyacetone kinase / FAD-AMP lyase (cyclizing)